MLMIQCHQSLRQNPSSSNWGVQARYGVTFPLFQKVEALGQDAHPVFKFLTQNSPGGSLVSWNFNKWLINRQGMPVKRYDSAFDRQQLEEDIAAELLKSA